MAALRTLDEVSRKVREDRIQREETISRLREEVKRLEEEFIQYKGEHPDSEDLDNLVRDALKEGHEIIYR